MNSITDKSTFDICIYSASQKNTKVIKVLLTDIENYGKIPYNENINFMLKTPENDKLGSISKLDSVKSINPKA